GRGPTRLRVTHEHSRPTAVLTEKLARPGLLRPRPLLRGRSPKLARPGLLRPRPLLRGRSPKLARPGLLRPRPLLRGRSPKLARPGLLRPRPRLRGRSPKPARPGLLRPRPLLRGRSPKLARPSSCGRAPSFAAALRNSRLARRDALTPWAATARPPRGRHSSRRAAGARSAG